MIYVKSFEKPDWNINEIKRYAKIIGKNTDIYDELIDCCIAEAEPVLSYRVCYTVVDVNRTDDGLYLGNIKADSATISKAIKNAEKAVIFAATVGAPFDRLIAKYSVTEPSKALLMQAIGAERVESLCDAFCAFKDAELKSKNMHLTTRVSPGYGDISLEMQRDIFAVLECPKHIGLTLDSSLMMSPSKSVTAISGYVDGCRQSKRDGCTECNKLDCEYRTAR